MSIQDIKHLAKDRHLTGAPFNEKYDAMIAFPEQPNNVAPPLAEGLTLNSDQEVAEALYYGGWWSI